MLNDFPEKILVTPLAAESFGVRSMCTYISTPDLRILVDPGVSLGKRFGLPPHPEEYRALQTMREKILKFAAVADIETISHYHFDHYTPTFSDYIWHWSTYEAAEKTYGNKLILAKSIKTKINYSQRRRGWLFRETVSKIAKSIEDADGRCFKFGGTTLRFSDPVYHGEEHTALGWVLMLTVEYAGEHVTHASDVQGPLLNSTLDMLLSDPPQLLIVSGPPVYLTDYSIDKKSINIAVQHLATLAEKIPIIILEHHLLRAEDWRIVVKPVYESAEEAGHKVYTAAEFLGLPNNLLEQTRRLLYKMNPPTNDFIKWTKTNEPLRKITQPPI